MKVALFALLIAASTLAEEDNPVYTENNPLELKSGKVFYSSYGQIYDLYTTDKEIRNILVPPSEYLSMFDFYDPDVNKHPPVFFNLYKNGQSEGVYMLKEQTATKIKDGSDTTADCLDSFLNKHLVLIYISASDGIYIYNLKNDVITKFGTITDNFKAIDKVPNKDEIYALANDDKIYKITAQGTVKTKVDGIDYAKDFVLDGAGAIYFIGADNKPQVLYKGTTTPVKITGLNFEVNNSLLSRPSWDMYSASKPEHLVPFIIDGVSYVLMNSSAVAVPCDRTVPGLTAFSAQFSYIDFYGEKGHIYLHSLVADNPTDTLKGNEQGLNKQAEADFRALKNHIHKH